MWLPHLSFWRRIRRTLRYEGSPMRFYCCNLYFIDIEETAWRIFTYTHTHKHMCDVWPNTYVETCCSRTKPGWNCCCSNIILSRSYFARYQRERLQHVSTYIRRTKPNWNCCCSNIRYYFKLSLVHTETLNTNYTAVSAWTQTYIIYIIKISYQILNKKINSFAYFIYHLFLYMFSALSDGVFYVKLNGRVSDTACRDRPWPKASDNCLL